MIDRTLVKTYPEPEVDEREVLRYAGCRGESEQVEKLLQEVKKECKGVFTYKVCYRYLPVTEGETLDLGFMQTSSRGLKENLSGCQTAVVFAASVGIGIDRLIAKYSRLSSAKAVLLQAYGAERVEALCDAFCEDLEREEQKNSLYTRPRFSPGYGDLPLEVQKDIVSLLNANRYLGVGLNDSLLLSPSKSVTAFVGLSDRACREKTKNCDFCDNKNCSFRR